MKTTIQQIKICTRCLRSHYPTDDTIFVDLDLYPILWNFYTTQACYRCSRKYFIYEITSE